MTFVTGPDGGVIHHGPPGSRPHSIGGCDSCLDTGLDAYHRERPRGTVGFNSGVGAMTHRDGLSEHPTGGCDGCQGHPLGGLGLPFHALGERPGDCSGCQEVAANPLHIHGRAGECPVPGCQEAPAAELPTALYRIEFDVPESGLRPLAGVRYQEHEAAAITEIEDALDEGVGVRSVHRLNLGGAGECFHEWIQLVYQPPGPGRLVAPEPS